MATLYSAARHVLPESHVLAGLTAVAVFAVGATILNVLHQLLVPQPKNEPPRVFHVVPVIGNAVTYGMDPYKFMFDCREKYGEIFTFVLLGRRMTVALGPAGNNMILNGKLAHVNAEEAYTHLTTPVFGTDVVFDCPNHLLMEQKKFMKVGLSTEAFSAYIPLIRQEVHLALANLVFGKKTDSGPNHLVSTSDPKDCADIAGQITVCTAASTLQGKEVREGLDGSFAYHMHDLDGGFTPINFMFPNLPLPSYRKRDVAHVKMRNFYLDVMKKRRSDGSFEDPDRVDILKGLQGTAYKDGRAINDKEIAHMMIALLMAGQHTSAATLSWLLLHLGEKPELQEALYREQVETYGQADGSLAPLSLDKLQTPLINSCIKEVLRMHPPIHSLIRKVSSDLPVTHIEGRQYVVPKGYYVLAAPGVTQVDPKLWPEPLEFKPTRWISGKQEKAILDQIATDAESNKQDFGWGVVSTGASSPYIPFGAGRHRCIGEQFAHVQLGTILATLVRECTWSLPTGKVPDQDYTTMIVMPKAPRNVVFKRRQS